MKFRFFEWKRLGPRLLINFVLISILAVLVVYYIENHLGVDL